MFGCCKAWKSATSGSGTLGPSVLRRAAVLLALVPVAAALTAAPAGAQPTQLFPGTTYETGVQFTPHGPVAIHVVRGPKPVGLYRLRPVLSNDSIVQRETVSAMQRRLATQATSVGVNGDFFSPADGRPRLKQRASYPRSRSRSSARNE